MPEIDPTFTALPYRELGAAALARAQELGASHADFRFERVRYQHVGVRDGALQGASDTEDLGFAVRVIHRGAWGFASGVILTDDEAVRLAETRGRRRRGRRRDDHDARRARSRAGLRRRHLGLVLPRQPARRADRREGRAARRLDRPAAPGCRRRPRVRVRAAGPGEQVLRRPGRHDHDPAADPDPPGLRGDGRRGRHLRLDGEHRAAGRPRLGVPDRPGHRGRLRLGRRARPGARAARREAQGPQHRGRPLRPGHPPVQPVAHHPRVDRPRDRARPGAGLRGQLRRHVVRDVRQAQHAPVRLPGDERDRRPHRRARARDGRLRRRGRRDPVVGHRQGRRPGRLPARPADGPHEARAQHVDPAAAPTAAPTPTPPATSRSSGWPTSPSRPPPTDRAATS